MENPCAVPIRVSESTRCKIRVVGAHDGRKLHKVVELAIDEYAAGHGIDVSCCKPAKPDEAQLHPELGFSAETTTTSKQ